MNKGDPPSIRAVTSQSDKLKQTVILIRGGPAVGKTTIGRTLRDHLGSAILISVDEIVKMMGEFTPYTKKWAHIGSRQLAEVYANLGWHIIFEELFDSRRSLENTRQWAVKHDLPCVVFHLTCDFSNVLIRNKEASRDILTDRKLEELTSKAESSIPSDAIKIDTANSIEAVVSLMLTCLKSHTSRD